jgi:hypothetical protein
MIQGEAFRFEGSEDRLPPPSSDRYQPKQEEDNS